jgi:hypothetical protein
MVLKAGIEDRSREREEAESKISHQPLTISQWVPTPAAECFEMKGMVSG